MSVLGLLRSRIAVESIGHEFVSGPALITPVVVVVVAAAAAVAVAVAAVSGLTLYSMVLAACRHALQVRWLPCATEPGWEVACPHNNHYHAPPALARSD
eukprot:gene11449-biopygen1131